MYGLHALRLALAIPTSQHIVIGLTYVPLCLKLVVGRVGCCGLQAFQFNDMKWSLWDRWVLEGDLTVQQVLDWFKVRAYKIVVSLIGHLFTTKLLYFCVLRISL